MPNSKKLLQAAAGSAGGAGVIPEGTMFNGLEDSLSRTGLTGSSDGRQVTFSFWAYLSDKSSYLYDVRQGTSTQRFIITDNGKGRLTFEGRNSSSSTILSAIVDYLPMYKWFHIVLSVNLTSTSNRYVYVTYDGNEYNYSTSQTTWSLYTNQDLVLSATGRHTIGGLTDGSGDLDPDYQGGLAHFFYDDSYLNLSTASNRRKFTDSDGNPAEGQGDLNPLIYLPMTDPTTGLGSNEGTGGDFTVGGAPDVPVVGINEVSCVAAYYDGSPDDYVRAGYLTGLNDGTQFTWSANFVSWEDYNVITGADSSGSSRMLANYTNFDIETYNASPLVNYRIRWPNYVKGKFYSMQFSYNNGTYKWIVNGEDITSETTTPSTTLGDWQLNNNWYLGSRLNGADSMKGYLGEVYLDDSYMDLSSSNPFWDSDNNEPVPLRTAIDTIGSSPILAAPLVGQKNLSTTVDGILENLGTGGQLAQASGALSYDARGALGGNERWVNSSNGDASNYLSGTPTWPSSSTLSIAFAYKTSQRAQHHLQWSGTDSGSLYFENSGSLRAWTNRGKVYTQDTSFSDNRWNMIFVKIDTSSSSNWTFHRNGVKSNTSTASTVTSGNLNFGNFRLFSSLGQCAMLYMTTDNLDFDDPDVSTHFCDAFFTPKDLDEAISNGDIPTPEVYLKMQDPDNWGYNYGTGGNLTENGTITEGSSFVADQIISN